MPSFLGTITIFSFVLMSILQYWFGHFYIERPNDGDCEIQLNKKTTIEGKAMKIMYDYRKYCAYLGIPYAEPPVGKLRFEPPKALNKSMSGTIIAKNLGNACYQQDYLDLSYWFGDEDCLYLNIYTPSYLKNQRNANRTYPVMFWIHGGGFRLGSGSNRIFGPDYLIAKGVILVAINYRLIIPGFLSAPEWGIYGNMGLKDQRLALRWVYENIAKFGGDRNRITIFGESAGAACVHYLLMDKTVNKYFQRAILQSGTGLNPWASQLQPEPHFQKLKAVLNITTKEELDSIDIEPLTEAAVSLVPNALDRKRRWNMFRPVIESPESPEPIITSSTYSAMTRGELPNDKQIIIGFNNAEGLIAMSVLQNGIQEIEHTLENIEDFVIQNSLLGNCTKNSRNSVLYRNLSRYYNEVRRKTNLIEAYVRFMSDGWLLHSLYGLLKSVFMRRTNRHLRLFLYKFSDDNYSIFKKHVMPDEWKNLSGSCHSDELWYIFSISKVVPVLGTMRAIIPEAALTTHRRMVEMWTNFAKTGDPLKNYDVLEMSNNNLEDIKWEPYSNENRKYLEMKQSDFTMQSFREADRLEIWNELHEEAIKNCEKTAD